MWKSCSCRNFNLALSTVHSFLAVRYFTVHYLTRYDLEIYHFEHKQILTGFKIVFLQKKNSNDRHQNSSLVCVQNGISLFLLAEKNPRGYPLNIFVQNVVRGNAVQMLSNFPAKRPVWQSNNFPRSKWLCSQLKCCLTHNV